MKRTHAVPLGEILHDFFKENPLLRQTMLEVRIQRTWGELVGPMIFRSTKNLFVKNRVLHVFLNSSVVRNELLLHRKQLLKSLNEYAGEEVIVDIIIR
jgi:predicted nucleic acid-binding Zn ribbon protein